MSELLKINVSEHTEKKNGLTYLSWAWAWAEVLKLDPDATWDAVEFNGFPASFAPDGSALVKTIVTIKGKAKSCWLPVMNHRNQAIKNPDAFNINTAIVRCLTKCISMHGLGLYIYAGEDLPEDDAPQAQKQDGKAKTLELQEKAINIIAHVKGGNARDEAQALSKLNEKALNAIWDLLDAETQDKLSEAWPA